MVQTKFKDLNLKNAFLFAAALSDPETCQIILEMILGREIPSVRVHTEHTLMYSSELRSLRLDVYAKDEMEVGYNLEMQNNRKEELPKRSRFHQAQMDVAALKPGDCFMDLKPSYVIFICTFDPFGRGRYCYTYEQRCVEDGFPLEDETCRIFLNTRGTNDAEVPQLLVDFLHYVEKSDDACASQAVSPQIEKLHTKIQLLKRSREWEAKYMTVDDYIRDQAEEVAQEMAQEMVQEMVKEMVDKARIATFAELIRDGMITMEQAATKLNMTVEELQTIL